MRFLVGLEEIGDADGALVGGKALALSALQRAGQKLPRTLCLTTAAYERFVEAASLRAVIRQELGRKPFEDMRWEEIWDLALRIRNRFLRAPIPEEIAAAVRERLAGEPELRALAVRSSAPGEDSGQASFAGLHDSFVGVRGAAEALDAVRRVWASLWTDRALLYRRELGIDVDTSAMAVVIQELVEGVSSGVAFGVHPSEPELAVVEAVYGLNQGLVDGTIEPDRWTLDRRSGRVVEHTPPGERRRLVARGAELVVEAVPAAFGGSPPLDEAGLAMVFEALRTAQGVFGAPQDVEWTLSDGRIVLLQARPVTAAAAGEGDKRAWYLSLTRSLDSLRRLRERVERELLPAMDREAEELAGRDPAILDVDELANEIEARRAAHDRWVEIYWREFIPLAHGIRLFGQFYNDVVRPDDPYEFMGLLAATPMVSVRRNRELSALASRVRQDKALRSLLETGASGDEVFERELDSFQHEFGGAVYADQTCFGDRARLVRFLLALAAAPAPVEPAAPAAIERLAEAFLDHVAEERRALARELLDLGRASYRLRDDDNIHLARLESLVLEAVEVGRGHLKDRHAGGATSHDLENVVRALRNPNLVVEPEPVENPPVVEPGFRARPRQLVGQPSGPGVATGIARVIGKVDDLFEFRAGEVLVCDAVDPNMTFVVPMASAIVERRGGMLIHGAIIAREYGLPCVTGVPQATTLIADGDHLTVDGYLGIVTVHSDETAA
jgi:pyruvate,water dikinase